MISNETQDIGRAAGGNEAPGKLLGEARLAQNLSIADVARQLKLSVNQVEALEAGDFQRLPGAVFVRGFVRNYARLLKLDVEPLLKSVTESLPREEPRPAAPPSHDIPFPTAAPRRWRGYAAALAAIVVALAAYEFFPGGSESAKEPPVAVTPVPSAPVAPPAIPQDAASASESAPGAAAPGAADEAKGEGPPQAKPEEPARPATGQPPQPAAPATTGGLQGPTQAATSVPAVQGAPTAAAKSVAREEDLAPAPGERQVRMVFQQASWVEIRDRSGKPIFSQLNPPGTEQRVNGRPPLAVIVGNAHGVRLTYDEQPVNLSLHTKVDVARLTLQ